MTAIPKKLHGKRMLVVIGAMKCATSSLHAYLKGHPALSMSKPKELDFFIEEKRWPKGYDWYASRFDDTCPVWGESSPNYTKAHEFAGVPKRMAAVIPDATLVYIMRNPVDRLISHYMHNRDQGRERRSFDEALADPDNNNYIETSKYFAQVSRFLEVYPREQLLLVDIRELKTSPEKVLRTVYEAVGVDPTFESKQTGKVYHNSDRKRVPRTITRKIERLPGGVVWRYLFPFLLTKPLTKPEISPETRGRLVEHLRADVENLEALWGRNLPHWKQ